MLQCPQTSLLCNATLPRASNSQPCLFGIGSALTERLSVEHGDIEKRHWTVFIEGAAIAGFSENLGSNVVVNFSSSCLFVAWVASEKNIHSFILGHFKSYLSTRLMISPSRPAFFKGLSTTSQSILRVQALPSSPILKKLMRTTPVRTCQSTMYIPGR